MRSITKHRFIKGRQGVAKGKAHIKYIQYRAGDDKDRTEPARSFFDKDRDKVLGVELRKDLEDWDGRGVAMHTIVLSPGINGIDLREYTREVMDELSRQKGQELDWKGLIHKNTSHEHVHLCVMGRDLNGRDVRLSLKDMRHVEKAGDRYLEREHHLDRYLDRELHDLTTREAYDRRGDRDFKELFANPDLFKELEAKRERDSAKLIAKEDWDKDEAVRELPNDEKIYANDNIYSKFSDRKELLELNAYLKETELFIRPDLYDKMWTWIGVKNRAGDDFYEKEARGLRDYQDYEDFKKFEEDMSRALRPDAGAIPRSVRGHQRILEQQGRMSDYHETYTNSMRSQRLEEIAEHQPENSDWAQRELAQMKFADPKTDYEAKIDKVLESCEMPWTSLGKDRSIDREISEIEILSANNAPSVPEQEPTIDLPHSDSSPTDDDHPRREDANDSEVTDVRMDLLGGRRQTFDDSEIERHTDRDFMGNER